LRFFLRGHSPFGRGNRHFIVCAFNHDPAISFAKPFEIKTIGHVLWRLLFSMNDVERLLHRKVKHTNLSRSREVANVALLERIERTEARMNTSFLGIAERKQTTRKVRTCVAL